MGFPDLIHVTSSAGNIDLARKRKLGPQRKICMIKNVLFNHFYHLANNWIDRLNHVKKNKTFVTQ